MGSWDSPVSVVTTLRAGQLKNRGPIPGVGYRFSTLQRPG